VSPLRARSGFLGAVRNGLPSLALQHRAEGLAASLPPLLIAAERVAATVAQGVHGRRRVGQGDTFWQFRQYQPGDAAARIDWRESAKTQRLYIRETEWEAAQSVWLWRDASASMEYSSSQQYEAAGSWPTKRERAELLLLALASLLVRGGEQVSLLGGGRPPIRGDLALPRLAELLFRGPFPDAAVPPFEPLPPAADLVLIGDFLAPLNEIHAAVGRFAAAGVKGYLLHIADPAEEDLPFTGRVRFCGIEEREEFLVGRVENVQGDYAERFRRHRDGLSALARAFGWGFGFHRTDRPPHLALLGLFNAFSQKGRG
jgi:uncharacterized protein (DUF58 family)